jgi:hypothetical protein
VFAAGAHPAVGDGCCPPGTEQPDALHSQYCSALEDPLPLPPTYVLCNAATESESSIKVEIGTTGTEANPNGWGGGITGIYYRDPSTDPWGTNMIHNLPGGLAQVALYEGPPSQYFSDTEGWNVFQGCHPDGIASPAWITGQGTSPAPWLSIRTYPFDSSVERDDCIQLDQKVLVYNSYIEVQYSVSQRPNYPPPPTQHPPSHPVMFHEGPCVYGWPGITYDEADPDRLNIEKMYDGINPWSAGDLTVSVGTGYNQVFPSEEWIGLYRPSDEYGLTLAYPRRTRHQPYCHMWAFYEDCCLQIAWARPFFDIVRDSGETISWIVYAIPGDVATGRKWAYELLPHRNWEFAIDGCLEGWRAADQLGLLSVQGGLLKAKSNGTSPQLQSLDMLDLASESVTGLTLSLSVTAGTEARLYYITEEDQTWDTAKSKAFAVTPDGAFHTYYVQLDAIAGWGGKTIRALRLRPTNRPTAPDGVKIDFMRLATKVSCEFNAENNNEGWTPVTIQLSDPASPGLWPNGNVTGGSLVLHSGGTTTDTYTDPDTTIWPSLLGPYPTFITPGGGPNGKSVQVRLKYVGGPPGTRTARLRYTYVYDPRVFDYHGHLPDHPEYSWVTRFDEAGHAPIIVENLPRDTWTVATFQLPGDGVIDQLMLEPTHKAGVIYIDYIRVVISP